MLTRKNETKVAKTVVKCDNFINISNGYVGYALSDAETEKLMQYIENELILGRDTRCDYAEEVSEEFKSMQEIVDSVEVDKEDEAPKQEKKSQRKSEKSATKATVTKTVKASTKKSEKSDNFDKALYRKLGEEFEVVGKGGKVYRYARPVIYAVMDKTMTKKAASIEIANLKAKYGY